MVVRTRLGTGVTVGRRRLKLAIGEISSQTGDGEAACLWTERGNGKRSHAMHYCHLCVNDRPVRKVDIFYVSLCVHIYRF